MSQDYLYVDIKGIEGLKKKLKRLGDKAPTAMCKALNAAASKAKQDMGKETAARYHIGSKKVKDTVRITKASRGNLKAALVSKGEALKLKEYKLKSGRRIRAAVLKGPTRPIESDPKAFMATMKSGHTAPFRRREPGEKRADVRDTREPGKKQRLNKHNISIQEFYGPSVPSIIKNEGTIRVIQKNAKDKLAEIIDKEVAKALQKG